MPSEKNICVYTVMIGNYEALNEQPLARARTSRSSA